MGIAYNPRIVTEGLTYYLDAGNSKSVPKTNILSPWTEYNNGSAHYEILGDYSIKLKDTSTGWIGYYPANVISTGKYIITFTYYSDVDGSYVNLDNDGIMDNTYNVTLLANTTPQIYAGAVNVTTTGNISHFFQRGSGGNIFVTNVSYFKLEDSCNDLSGNGNTGTLVNGVGYNSTNGGTLNFDGVDDYISVPYSSALDTPNGATYSVWIYPTSSGEFLTRGTSDSGNTPDNPRFYINVSGGQIYFDWSSPGLDRYVTTSSNSFENNKWINIVGVAVAGGRLDVYVNGSLCAYQTRSNADTMSSPLPNTNNEIQIGGATWLPRYFGGRISSVSLYNRVLTDSEIQQNFNATRGRYGV